MELKEKLQLLLNNKGVTPYEVSIKSGVPQSSISRVLSGETKKLSTKNKTILANYFDIKEDYFNNTNEIDAPFNTQKIKSEIKEVGFDEFMEAEYLPITAQAGYLAGLEDKHPIELKKMLVPKEFDKGYYKVIEIEGDSMNDGTPRSICDGDKLLLKQVDGGNYLQKTLPYRNNLFVIVSRDGIVCKQIVSQDIEKGCITCHSFNPLHKDYEICFEDVHQLFYVKKLVERKIKF